MTQSHYTYPSALETSVSLDEQAIVIRQIVDLDKQLDESIILSHDQAFWLARRIVDLLNIED